MKSGSKNNRRKKTTTRKQIRRLCEWSPTCTYTAEWHAVEYCLDYCSLHKQLEIAQHKKAGIPHVPSWEKIKHPEFAKVLPPYGPTMKRPAERLSLGQKPVEKNRHFAPLITTAPSTKSVTVSPGPPVNIPLSRKLLEALAPDQLVLAEFVCTGCRESRYIPTWGMFREYPSLEEAEELLCKNMKNFGQRHVAPHTAEGHEHPDGYSYCGDYKLVRLWREWEDPKRHEEEKNK